MVSRRGVGKTLIFSRLSKEFYKGLLIQTPEIVDIPVRMVRGESKNGTCLIGWKRKVSA